MKEKRKYNYIDNVGFRSNMIFGKVSKVKSITYGTHYDLIELEDCPSEWWYHYRWLKKPLTSKLKKLLQI